MNFKWSIKNDYPKEKNGFKVYSTFSCGGGSSMGYKLAGYEVIGANDIDPEMRDVYIKNHNPKLYHLCPIKDLIDMELPDEMYNLDILDGSPPCSTFSMSGLREKAWGKNKKFREGQEIQILDDLFFDFIELAKKLQPKIVVAENVKGMLAGNAKGYLIMIKQKLEEAGYNVQLFLLNSATMGVPQRRERVFFIASRKDLNLPKIKLDFNEKVITFSEMEKHTNNVFGKKLSDTYLKYWVKTPPGKSFSYAHPKGSFFNSVKVSKNKVLNTITASSGAKITHYREPYQISNDLLALSGTFPIDYNYLNTEPQYLIGMSVPPIMIAKIAIEIEKQLLKNL